METSVIKHLILSGGGIAGITLYGILREANKTGCWNIENIESIYGTSAGSIVALYIALKYDWEEIDNYIIKRPWENVFKIDVGAVLRSFDAKGIFGKKIIEEMTFPLLKGKDLDTTITLKELYEYNKIDFHIFTTEINTYTSIDISHKTHPDWKVIDAIYCSACLPIIFIPYINENVCYIDGGITNNYPIYTCLDNGANPEEILGIRLPEEDINQIGITETCSLFDYLSFILNRMYKQAYIASIKNREYSIKYEVELENAIISIYDFVKVSSSQEQRYLLLDKGVEIWKTFMEKIANREPCPNEDK